MSGDVSPAALAANRRLQEMRAELAARRAEAAADGLSGRGGGASHSLNSFDISHPTANATESDALDAKDLTGLLRPVRSAGGVEDGRDALVAAAPVAARLRRPSNLERGESRFVSHSEEFFTPLHHTLNTSNASPSLAAHIERVAALPTHLGWGSETLTAHLRKLRIADGAGGQGSRGAGEKGRGGKAAHVLVGHDQRPTTNDGNPPNSYLVSRSSNLIKVYPDIALGMLREERTAAGRVWLLLRAIDAPGRGMVNVDEARAALCGKGSALRLCGWRRLRQLLAEGEGVFWTREQGREPRRQTTDDGPQQKGASDRRPSSVVRRPPVDRLRLHGPARVAAALGVRRLVGRPVGVPVTALLGPIGDARAHLYAAFHSGRAKENTNYELRITNEESAPNPSLAIRHSSLGNPIARDTLTALSGVCARSQAAYERRAGVAARANIALGERVAAAESATPAEQERAWRHGRALFRLRDCRGLHGRPGTTYLAWRLPNGYGPARDHQQRPKGQQKRINRQLTDLFTKGMTGNGGRIEKRFYATATAAVKRYEFGIVNHESKARSSLVTRHWPLGGVGRGGCGVWATVEPATDPTPWPPALDHAIPQASQPSFFGDRGGKELRGL